MDNQLKKAVLMGIAGSNNTFCLSLYNLKAYAFTNPLVLKNWNFSIIQHPLISSDKYEIKLNEHTHQILDKKPDLVAFSCYIWNVHYFKKLAEQLKKERSKLKIVIGGPEMDSDYIKEGRFDDFFIDYCISGEGEVTFLELLKHLTVNSPEIMSIDNLSYRKKDSHHFITNKKRKVLKSLSEIPSPYLSGNVDDKVLFRGNVEANIETQRGCNFRCSYCVYHKDYGRISYSNESRTIEEIRFVISKGVKRIRIVDANFSSNLDHAKSIMQKIIDNKFETRLMFELIPGFIDEELAQLFNKFNNLCEWNEVSVGIGVQSINLQVLRKIRRAISLEKFEKTFDLLQKYNIYAKIDLIIGLPSEDLKSIENTLEYMMNKLQYSQSHLLCCHIMRGLPGTELLRIAEEYGMNFTSEFEPHELYDSPALPRRDMLKCLRRTAVIFRLVNYRGWANREFLFDKRSKNTNIRDTFFATKESLGLTNIQLIDLIIDGLMKRLNKESYFVNERFPYAENWWWSSSKLEIKNKWILDYLNKLKTLPDI